MGMDAAGLPVVDRDVSSDEDNDDDGGGVSGRLMVPWSSRIARPEGVCRSCGRGLRLVGFDGELCLG